MIVPIIVTMLSVWAAFLLIRYGDRWFQARDDPPPPPQPTEDDPEFLRHVERNMRRQLDD